MADTSRTVEVLVLTQGECKFCDEAKVILDRLATEFPLRILTDDLNSAKAHAIALSGGLLFPPGIVIDGRPFSYGRLSEGKLRRELDRRAAAKT